MKISWNHLQSWFSDKLDKDLVLERLTMAGLEVEDESALAPEFSGIVIGEVVACSPHPDADKLSLCQVNVGAAEPLQIICGASNVALGVRVPCAKVGAVLPGNFKIGERKMRGLISYGMLCSGDELGCPNGVDGLYLLPSDAPVGTDIRSYLDLDDIIIEFKITPNRGDCLSYLGLAREIAALTGNQLAVRPALSNYLTTPSQSLQLSVSAPEACPHYVGLVINGVNNTLPTPSEISRVLERSGIRTISPLVDITNYVMLSVGQPMHAFDLNQVQGGIQVSLAQGNEQLTLIDGKNANLSANTLLISDQNATPLALAGVMGGSESGVTSETSAILLESAFFSPAIMQGKTKHYGVNSDSAFRFERGVDYQLQHDAINLAASLVLQICGGESADFIHFSNVPATSAPIKLDLNEVHEFIGQHLPENQICQILTDLGCAVERAASELSVLTPSYRFDLQIKEDLIEEIIRVYGYDKIEPVMPRLTHTLNSLDSRLIQLNQFKHTLVALGCHEIISYAFIEDKYAASLADPRYPQIKLQNPIAGLNQMRNSLLPDLVKALESNLNRGQTSLRLFELARVFHGEAADQQPLYLSGLIAGNYSASSWNNPRREVDFYDLSSVLEELFAQYLGYKLTATADSLRFHPGRCAVVSLAGQAVGVIGQLHPALVQQFGLNVSPYLFELNLDLIGEPAAIEAVAQHKFQKVFRDLALVLDQSIAVGEVLAAFRALPLASLREVSVFDVFNGGSLAATEKSVAFNFIFQADKTLADDEINSYLDQIKQLATTQFAAKLR